MKKLTQLNSSLAGAVAIDEAARKTEQSGQQEEEKIPRPPLGPGPVLIQLSQLKTTTEQVASQPG